MNIELSIQERILLTLFFPQNGSYKEMQAKRELSNAIQISVEEMEKVEFSEYFDEKTQKSGFRWNRAKDTGLVIDVPVTTVNFLKQWASKLDKEGLINDDNIDLYERILAL